MPTELTVINTKELLHYNKSYEQFKLSQAYQQALIIMNDAGIGKVLADHLIQSIFIYAYTKNRK